MAKIIVYHGGYTGVNRPEIRIGRYTKDFGEGFYCTVIREQAERWAKRYSNAYVSSYHLTMNESLNIKEFKEMNDEWLEFIVASRACGSFYGDIYFYYFRAFA